MIVMIEDQTIVTIDMIVAVKWVDDMMNLVMIVALVMTNGQHTIATMTGDTVAEKITTTVEALMMTVVTTMEGVPVGVTIVGVIVEEGLEVQTTDEQTSAKFTGQYNTRTNK